MLLTSQIGNLLDSVLDPLIYSVHATACHVHASRLYRKNTLLSPLPSGKHGCHVPMHAQLARPPLFKVTVQGLGTLSSGTPAPGLPMRLCGSTLILIKPHFSGRESRVGGGVVERGARRSGINTHFNEGRTWAQVARLGRWHLTPSGSWATPLLLRAPLWGVEVVEIAF